MLVTLLGIVTVVSELYENALIPNRYHAIPNYDHYRKNISLDHRRWTVPGRYDIRYGTEEELKVGRNFQIVELNGAVSEATSIYDSRNSLLRPIALCSESGNWFSPSGRESSERCKPTPVLALWQKWREYAQHSATYSVAD
jgi:hypothetical protein